MPTSQPDPAPDESALIAGLRDRSPVAYQTLLRDYGGRMLAVAARIMGNEHDARDAVQDAFLAAIRGIGNFDGKSRLSTWLHRIVVNACLMKLRGRGRRPEQPIEPFLPRFDRKGHREDPGLAWNPDPGSGIEREGLLRACRGAIEKLPDAYREVLVLRDLEGLSTEEAAVVLQMQPGAVKTRLHRARQALRELLAPYMTGKQDPPAARGERP